MTKQTRLLGIFGFGIAAFATGLALASLLVFNAEAEHEQGGHPPGEIEQPPNAGSNSPVARVGGQTLTLDEYIKGLREDFGEEWILDWLERTVVRLEAKELGISISREQIDQELIRMQAGYDSESQFYQVMREQLGLTVNDLRADILHRLMLEAIVTRDVRVTEADIDQFMRDHPEEYGPQKEVRYALIVAASEADAQQILTLLGQGFDFATVAKDLSLDPISAPDGGDYGWININDPFLPEEIGYVLQSMKVGDISEPFLFSDGTWGIVNLLGRRTLDYMNDAAVRDSVRRQLAMARAPSIDSVLDMLFEKYGAEIIEP